MASIRFTFDGALIRPLVGISGGAYFAHWEISGSFDSAAGLRVLTPASETWSEPATSLDAGIRFVLDSQRSIELGGVYTAFSNITERIKPVDFSGGKTAGEKTATSIARQAGFRFVL